MVYLGGARTKAKTARILTFYASLENVLGAYTIGSWKFENNIIDSSEFHNNCLKIGLPTIYVIGFPDLGGMGANLRGGYLECSDDNIYKIEDFTYAAWIKRSDFDTVEHAIISHGGNRQMNVTNNKLEIESPTAGYMQGHTIIKQDQWYFVVFSYSYRDKTAVLYLDGQIEDKWTNKDMVATYNQVFRVGGCYCGGHNFHGILDEVRVYSGSVSYGQVQKLYAQGLESHKN